MKDLKKKFGIFAMALAISLIMAVAVFAVADYDSSADPLISHSYLIKYINDNVLLPQNSRLQIIENKLSVLEEMLDALIAAPPSSGSSVPGETGGVDTPPSEGTLNTIMKLAERISAIESKMAALNSEHTSLSDKYGNLQKENDALKAEINSIKQQINDYLNDSGKEDIAELEEKYNSLVSELKSLKNSTTVIQQSFSDITKSYVSLQKEVYNLNTTIKELSSSDSSVLKDLFELSNKMNELGTQLNNLMTKNMSFDLVKLDKGDSIVAKGLVYVMLQYGEATASSPLSEIGTGMEYTDLTSGSMISDGDRLPLNHNIFIPGNGRTSVVATGEHGIYVFVGGDYEIVKLPENIPPETGGESETSSPESGALNDTPTTEVR